MNYFVLSQKKQAGCPQGSLNAALYDRFYSDTKKIEHGFFPWYAEGYKKEFHTPYPDGMVLISEDKKYDFEVRNLWSVLYVVSEEFLSVCKLLGVKVVDAVPISVVSKAGAVIAKKNYYAALFEELDVRTNTAVGTSFVEEDGLILRFKKLILPEDINRHLFKFSGLISGSGSLICSEVFREHASEFKGVEFVPLVDVVWSQIKSI